MVGKKKRAKLSGGRSKKSKGSIVGRINMAQRNFILFLVLFVVFFVLNNFSTNLLFENFFGVLYIISGFISLAFLISLVILFIISGGRKKRR